MTAYYVTGDPWSMAIRAVTYEIRISQILLYSTGSGGTIVRAIRHESSTLTRGAGGGVLDVVPLYQGAPAASTTGMWGALNFTGTPKVVGSTYLPPGENSDVVGTTVIHTFPGSTSQIQSPLTLTVAPGSVLEVIGDNEVAGTCQIYFEELRLAGSY